MPAGSRDFLGGVLALRGRNLNSAEPGGHGVGMSWYCQASHQVHIAGVAAEGCRTQAVPDLPKLNTAGALNQPTHGGLATLPGRVHWKLPDQG